MKEAVSQGSSTVIFKLDWYSRAVLTVIAACLVAMLTKPIWTSAKAKAASQILDVNIAEIGGHSYFSTADPIRVTVK